MRLFCILIGLGTSLSLTAQESEESNPPRIIVPPPQEKQDIRPGATFMALSDGRVISLQDWSKAILANSGMEIPSDPLVLDFQTGRIARLWSGEDIGVGLRPLKDPILQMAQLGKRLEHLPLSTYFASIGRMRDGSPLAPLWCEATDTSGARSHGICQANYDGPISSLVDVGPKAAAGDTFIRLGIEWLESKTGSDLQTGTEAQRIQILKDSN